MLSLTKYFSDTLRALVTYTSFKALLLSLLQSALHQRACLSSYIIQAYAICVSHLSTFQVLTYSLPFYFFS